MTLAHLTRPHAAPRLLANAMHRLRRGGDLAGSGADFARENDAEAPGSADQTPRWHPLVRLLVVLVLAAGVWALVIWGALWLSRAH